MVCTDCHVNLLLMKEVKRRSWDGIDVCLSCFSIRLARMAGLVPITSGHWVTKQKAEAMLSMLNGEYSEDV